MAEQIILTAGYQPLVGTMEYKNQEWSNGPTDQFFGRTFTLAIKPEWQADMSLVIQEGLLAMGNYVNPDLQKYLEDFCHAVNK